MAALLADPHGADAGGGPAGGAGDAGTAAAEEEEEGEGWEQVGGGNTTMTVRVHVAGHPSPVRDIFGGEVRSTLKFAGSSKASASLEPFFCLSLDIDDREVPLEPFSPLILCLYPPARLALLRAGAACPAYRPLLWTKCTGSSACPGPRCSVPRAPRGPVAALRSKTV